MAKKSDIAKAETASIQPVEQIESLIITIRGKQVILDRDLARLYGVDTKVLNQAVKRNVERFPDHFRYQLTENKTIELVTNCDRLKNLKHTNIMRKLFTFLIALVASISMMFASYTQVDGIWYDFDDTSLLAEVTFRGNDPFSYSNEYSGEIIIPEEVDFNGNQYRVVSINWGAFSRCTSLTSITIPNSIEYIGSGAFDGCTGLTSPVYNAHVFAFMPTSYIGSYTIPDGIELIAGGAFGDCYALTDIAIPNSVTDIGENAFAGCTGLTSPVYNEHVFAFMPTSYTGSYTIPDGIELIAGGAFSYCSELTSISIPKELTRIDGLAFSFCYNLTSVVWNARNCNSGDFGYQVESFIFGDDVDTIPDNCCSQMNYLTNITIPKSVTYIGSGAFAGCNNITTIVWNAVNCNSAEFSSQVESFTFGNDVEIIPDECCSGMNKLTSITIPESVNSIGLGAFWGCSGLTSINIPYNVAQIGDYAFMDCTSLNTIVWNAHHCADFSSVNFSPFCNVRPQITSFTIGNEVSHIPAYLCYGMNAVEEISVPCSVESIGKEAFEGCNINNNEVYSQLPDIIICHRGAQVCDDNGENCQTFYESGVYSNTYKSINGCDSIVTRNVILRQDTTWLSDTTVCYGKWVTNDVPQIRYNYRYVDENCPYTYEPECDDPLCGMICTSCQSFGDVQDFLNYVHSGELVETCPDGINCEEIYLNGQQFYSSGTYTCTYTNSHGCDSIVARNVIVSKVAAPKIIVTPEQDICNSGTIRIYNKYCTGSEYHEGQYKYYYDNAEYDYFTINGTKYEFSSAMEGEYNQYYHPDGIQVIDEPSMVIDNLSAGNYNIVFYSACDSVVEEVTIEGYAIEIDGVYYTYQEAYHRYDGYPYEAGAVVTYRGASPEAYDEYSGDIIIPESIIWNGIETPVLYIEPYSFASSKNITAITFKSPVPPICNNVLFTSVMELIHYVPFGSLDAYKQRFGKHWCYYASGGYTALDSEIHVIKPSQISVTGHATSATITVGNEEIQKHIASCGIVDGEEFGGNIAEYKGLTPNSTYTNVPFYIKTIEGDSDVINISFATTALELTTLASKPVASDAAILLAQTNIADVETSCGFEWKRNDAPEDMAPNKVYSPVANGTMAGRLKNLNDQVYYKYRAFYESAVGNMYYGDWQYIFTGDNAVEYDPVLYTYAATAVKEHEATLKGYALEGSDDFTEQGFEYWADSRVKHNKPGIRFKSQLGEKQTVVATGILMQVTLTDLDQGTTYKYRTFAKFGDQVAYGPEMSFTTQGEWVAFTITFLDKDGNVIATQEVESGDNAVAPDAPKVDGYKFIGWDKDLTNVQSNMTVTAQYAVAYTVRFVDWDGELLKNEQVAKGKDATPPEEPVRTGYNFTGWDKDYTNVQSDLTVTAQYKIKTFRVRFLDWNDTELKVETVEYGKSATAPEAPTREGYTFKGWDTEFDNVKSNLDVKAVYEKNADEAIDEINSSNSQTIKLIKHGNFYILRNGEIFNAQGARVE